MTKLYGYSTEDGEGYRTSDGKDWFDTTANGAEFDGQKCADCGCSIEIDQRVWVVGGLWMSPEGIAKGWAYPDRYFCHHHANIVQRPDGTRPLS